MSLTQPGYWLSTWFSAPA